MIRRNIRVFLIVLFVAPFFAAHANAQLQCGCRDGWVCVTGLGGLRCIPRSKPQVREPNYKKAPLAFDGGKVTGASQNWGEQASCPSQNLRGLSARLPAVTSVCASGANKDCASKIVNVGCNYVKNTNGVMFSVNVSPVDVSQSSWGNRVTCPDNKAVIAICGSGSNPDCGGKPAKIRCAGLSGSAKGFIGGGWAPDNRVVPRNQGSVWVSQTNWGGTASCPNNMVATGFCGSGGNKDCNGKVAELRCSPLR